MDTLCCIENFLYYYSFFFKKTYDTSQFQSKILDSRQTMVEQSDNMYTPEKEKKNHCCLIPNFTTIWVMKQENLRFFKAKDEFRY